ncbi:unnamed protein product, partial [Phaeothamnion confervicola]
RAALCRDLGIEGRSVSMAHQVHGAGVHRVGARPTDSLFPDALVGWPEADVLVTQEPDTPLMVLGADCLPVILWRRDHPALGVAHAGWRGLVGGVLEAAIGALGEPSRLGAAIGAGIGPCCYPVSAEVRERFATRFGDGVVAGEAVDLAGAARAALARCGVPASAIQVVAACT